MKLTEQKLKQIIKEELSAILNEQEVDPIPEGTGYDFQDWVYDKFFMSDEMEFQNYRDALAAHQLYFDHPNSMLFDDTYSQEEKDEEERRLTQYRRKTQKIFEAFRDLMQKGMTDDQIDVCDEIIDRHLSYY